MAPRTCGKAGLGVVGVGAYVASALLSEVGSGKGALVPPQVRH